MDLASSQKDEENLQEYKTRCKIQESETINLEKIDKFQQRMIDLMKNIHSSLTQLWTECGLLDGVFKLKLRLKPENDTALMYSRSSKVPVEYLIKFNRIRGVIYSEKCERVYKFNILIMDNQNLELDYFFCGFQEFKQWQRYEQDLQEIEFEMVDALSLETMGRDNNNEKFYILKISGNTLDVIFDNNNRKFKICLQNFSETDRVHGDFYYVTDQKNFICQKILYTITLRAIGNMIVEERICNNYQIKSRIIRTLINNTEYFDCLENLSF